jgi:hypothetical protein
MFKKGAGSLYSKTNFVFLDGGDMFWSSKKPVAGPNYQVKQDEKAAKNVLPLEQKRVLLFARVVLEAVRMRKDGFMEK